MAESKSTSAKRIKGEQAEEFAVHFLVSLGWSILACRLDIVGVEVDILARSPEGIASIVEVKSARVEFSNQALHWRQKQRLFRAAKAIDGEVQVLLALVDLKRSKVQLEFDLW